LLIILIGFLELEFWAARKQCFLSRVFSDQQLIEQPLRREATKSRA